MPAELVWLDEALDDLQAISDYISKDSPRAATRYTEAIATACAKLAEFPESGRRYGERYRALAVRNHMVFYSYDKEIRMVSITAIFHGRRNIEALLEKL